MKEVTDPGVTVFVGRFGCGKTEVAINYALELARFVAPEDELTGPYPVSPPNLNPQTGSRITLIDLDIVTPYFRSREIAEQMEDRGVAVIAPSFVGHHLDTPAITPQILGAIQQPTRRVVLDAGGDQQGARALGLYSSAIRGRGYTMHFVVNPYRPFTDTLEGVTQSMAEIEASARLQVTTVVSNPHLIGETTPQLITDGHARVEAFARALNLPISFVCIERRWAHELDMKQLGQPVLIIDRFFVMSWE